MVPTKQIKINATFTKIFANTTKDMLEKLSAITFLGTMVSHMSCLDHAIDHMFVPNGSFVILLLPFKSSGRLLSTIRPNSMTFG